MVKRNDTVEYDVKLFEELMAEAATLPKGNAKVATLSAAFNLAAFGSQAGQR